MARARVRTGKLMLALSFALCVPRLALSAQQARGHLDRPLRVNCKPAEPTHPRPDLKVDGEGAGARNLELDPNNEQPTTTGDDVGQHAKQARCCAAVQRHDVVKGGPELGERREDSTVASAVKGVKQREAAQDCDDMVDYQRRRTKDFLRAEYGAGDLHTDVGRLDPLRSSQLIRRHFVIRRYRPTGTVSPAGTERASGVTFCP